MVAAPCRAFRSAARWKGSPPHTTTGAASVSDSHCQYSNWSAGTIASTTTGSASAAETSSRRSSRSASVRSEVVGRPAGSADAAGPPGASGRGGAISCAE